VENESIECGIGNEFVVRVVVFFVATLRVNSMPLSLVKDQTLKPLKSDIPKPGVELFNQRRMFQTSRVNNLQRIKPLNSRQRPQIGEPLNNLTKVYLAIGGVIHRQAHLVRTVLNDADDVLPDSLLVAGSFGVVEVSSRAECAPGLLVLGLGWIAFAVV